ncbi:MAG TPA: hypothetical protein VFZ13_14995 [Gemmatimonadales bacterium]
MRAVLPVALLLALACAGTPAPVTVVGTETDLASLDGSWSGEYWGSGSGRSGSIVFEVRADSHSATGDVVMIPKGANRPLHRIHDANVSEASIPTSQLLTIRFVRIAEGRVSGELDPYHAPDCDCALLTRFLGTLRGDTISGTYETSGEHSRDRATGEWRVVRR